MRSSKKLHYLNIFSARLLLLHLLRLSRLALFPKTGTLMKGEDTVSLGLQFDTVGYFPSVMATLIWHLEYISQTRRFLFMCLLSPKSSVIDKRNHLSIPVSSTMPGRE